MKKASTLTLALGLGALGAGVTAPSASAAVVYRNCAEVRAIHGAPIPAGGYGYRLGLDRDRDGVACEDSFPAGTAASAQPVTQQAPKSTPKPVTPRPVTVQPKQMPTGPIKQPPAADGPKVETDYVRSSDSTMPWAVGGLTFGAAALAGAAVARRARQH